MRKGIVLGIGFAIAVLVFIFGTSNGAVIMADGDTPPTGTSPCFEPWLSQLLADEEFNRLNPNWYQQICRLSILQELPEDAEYLTVDGNPIPPRSPQSVNASISNGSVTITWTPNSAGQADYFRVHRRNATLGELYGGTGSVIWSDITANSFQDATVSPGQTYGYVVQGMNDSGHGDLSSETSVSLPSLPTRPTGLAANRDGATVSLTWNDPDDSSITSYHVLRRHVGHDAPGVFSQIGSSTGHSYADSGLVLSDSYVYRVVAVNASGQSPRSSYANARPTPIAPVVEQNPPGRPTGLTESRNGANVSLTWDDPDDSSITSYHVLRRHVGHDAPGVFSQIGSSTGHSYADSGLVLSDSYVYRVAAVNASGQSPRSSYANARPTPIAPVVEQNPPGRPTGLTESRNGANVSLTWDDPDDSSITSYHVLRRHVGHDAPGVFSQIGSSTGHSYADSGLVLSDSYVYRVVAVNASGQSPRSSYANAGP